MNRINIAMVGMPQSGTTALYNVINCILLSNNVETINVLYHPTAMHNRVVNESYLRRYKGTASILLKEHHFVPFLCNEWADIIFIMKRDIRDSIASRRRRGRPLRSKGKVKSGEHTYDPHTFEGFKKWCNYLVKDCYQDWLDGSSASKASIVLVDYQHFARDRLGGIREVFRAVQERLDKELQLDEADILHTIDNLTEAKEGKYFYSADKRTAGGKINNFHDRLSKQELDYINCAYSEWIEG